MCVTIADRVKSRIGLTSVIVEYLELEMIVDVQLSIGNSDFIAETIRITMIGSLTFNNDGHVVQVKSHGVLLGNPSSQRSDFEQR